VKRLVLFFVVFLLWGEGIGLACTTMLVAKRAKYDDGYVSDLADTYLTGEMGYPKSWYEKSRWPDGPISYKKPSEWKK